MKRTLTSTISLLLCIVMMLCVIFTGCDKKDNSTQDSNNSKETPDGETEATGIFLDRDDLVLTPGEATTLSFVITPKNTSDKGVEWASSDDSVVVVKNGTITAKKEGTAVVVASTSNGKTASCTVYVMTSIVGVAVISLNANTLEINKGDTFTLTASFSPHNAIGKNVSWRSSDITVATVSGGKVTAVGGGNATITATTSNGKTATCHVSVVDPLSEFIHIQLGSMCTIYGVKDKTKTEYVIPDIVTRVEASTFTGCDNMKSLVVGSGVTELGNIFGGNYSFSETGENNLESITVKSENVKYYSVGNCIIDAENKTLVLGCKNSVIPTDDTVTSIGGGAFAGCTTLSEITIPTSVISIGDDAFANCAQLSQITLSENLTSIGEGAFFDCTSLVSITIPKSVTCIGVRTFSNCSNLESVTFEDPEGWKKGYTVLDFSDPKENAEYLKKDAFFASGNITKSK